MKAIIEKTVEVERNAKYNIRHSEDLNGMNKKTTTIKFLSIPIYVKMELFSEGLAN
jgi:hypothetical protein